MKRLLCITGSLGVGGAETFLMKIYRHIDRNKYQFDFCINYGADNFYEKEINELGGKVFYIEAKTKNPIKFRKELSQLVKKDNYKYVLRIASNASSFWDLKIAKKAGAKICCARSSNSSDGGSVGASIAHKMGHILFSKYVDVAFAPSDLAADYTFGNSKYFKNKVTILNNAIDLNVYSYSKEKREQMRQSLGIAADEILIGHIGRFSEQKNHELLVEIFFEIQKNMQNVKMILVGNGPLEKSIRYKVNNLGINEKVIFAGVRTDIPELLSAMDVFVLPSLYEGMPNTVIEAQAVGVPCVISDTITMAANITGLVEFVPLSSNLQCWNEKIIKRIKEGRKDTKNDFIEKKYDIKSSAEKFLKTIFIDT